MKNVDNFVSQQHPSRNQTTDSSDSIQMPIVYIVIFYIC